MRLCDIDGCDRKHEGHGMCRLHRTRVQRTGDPHTVLTSRKDQVDNDEKQQLIDHIEQLKQAGMRVADIADAAGINESTIREIRRRMPTRNVTRRLLEVDGWHQRIVLTGWCETCGRTSMAGGRWCYPHFKDYVRSRRSQATS